jgi:16S rRNA processing protein RimM
VSEDTTSNWIVLARIVRPQGRRGEVLADIFTDFPESFSSRKRVFLRSQAPSTGQSLRETAVQSQWLHKGRVVLKFIQVDSIDEAEKLRGCEVVIPHEERMPLEADAVYVSDLIGAAVIDTHNDGRVLVGEIVDVEPEGVSPAMLVLRTPAGEERLIPFVRAYLRKIDITSRRVEMALPPGLIAAQKPAAEGDPDAL